VRATNGATTNSAIEATSEKRPNATIGSNPVNPDSDGNGIGDAAQMMADVPSLSPLTGVALVAVLLGTGAGHVRRRAERIRAGRP
jgi:hypothetical protein